MRCSHFQSFLHQSENKKYHIKPFWHYFPKYLPWNCLSTNFLFRTNSAAIKIIAFHLNLQWAAWSRTHLAERDEGEEEGSDWTKLLQNEEIVAALTSCSYNYAVQTNFRSQTLQNDYHSHEQNCPFGSNWLKCLLCWHDSRKKISRNRESDRCRLTVGFRQADQVHVPGRSGQKAAGKTCSGVFSSQETHLPLTQTQRSPGLAAAHAVGLEKAGQDGGV